MEEIKIPCTLWDGATLIGGEDDRVVLHPKYVEFIYKYEYEDFKDDENHALGRQAYKVDTEALVPKDKIEAIELKRNDKEKVYKVTTHCSPRSNSMFFKSRKEAKQFKDKLTEWWLS